MTETASGSFSFPGSRSPPKNSPGTGQSIKFWYRSVNQILIQVSQSYYGTGILILESVSMVNGILFWFRVCE